MTIKSALENVSAIGAAIPGYLMLKEYVPMENFISPEIVRTFQVVISSLVIFLVLINKRKFTAWPIPKLNRWMIWLTILLVGFILLQYLILPDLYIKQFGTWSHPVFVPLLKVDFKGGSYKEFMYVIENFGLVDAEEYISEKWPISLLLNKCLLYLNFIIIFFLLTFIFSVLSIRAAKFPFRRQPDAAV